MFSRQNLNSGNRGRRRPSPTLNIPLSPNQGSMLPSPVLASPGGSPGDGTNQKPLYMSRPFVDAALVKGNFKTIVRLPKYVDIMEWVAVNSTLQYRGTQSCATMSGGPRLNYTWINQDRRQVSLPAPTYIDYVMTSIQNLIDDENVFPTKTNQEFHQSFPTTVKHIYRQLLRVFAHIYHAHYPQILHLRAEPHFNSLFAHFLAFGREYELLEVKDIRGDPNTPVGVGALWERWTEMGILAA
ncbi:Maintenance of ploidy protein mob2 [Pleurotus pulmonarius]|nr:Maintenance of ploidy protein mob2 [Pleurotus pulmonarius]